MIRIIRPYPLLTNIENIENYVRIMGFLHDSQFSHYSHDSQERGSAKNEREAEKRLGKTYPVSRPVLSPVRAQNGAGVLSRAQAFIWGKRPGFVMFCHVRGVPGRVLKV